MSQDDSTQYQSQAADPAIGAAAEAHDRKLIATVQEYLAALESGTPLSRDELLARNPDIAHELAECLDGLEMIHHAAADAAMPELVSVTAARERVPQPLGDFRIIREIGRGGMGIVYEAVQLSLGRRVALKVLPLAASFDAKYLQRFKNEAQAAAQLHHTNIVPVYAVGSERGVHFYAMQLIDGDPLSLIIADMRELARQTLGERVSAASRREHGSPSRHDSHAATLPGDEPKGSSASRRRPASRREAMTEPLHSTLPPQAAVPTLAAAGASTIKSASHSGRLAYFQKAARLIEQAASALEHAHRIGIIHRDIKPANLLLDRRDNVWITDFGLAQFQADAKLTRTGDMLGTLRYMSPEQMAGDRVLLDHRTDIYSLGTTLYELLTLEPVFADCERHELLRRIIDDEPRAPRAIDKSIPLELETIVLKAIAKSPGERYATAEAMADDLRRFLDDKPILARRPTLRKQRSPLAATASLGGRFRRDPAALGQRRAAGGHHSDRARARRHQGGAGARGPAASRGRRELSPGPPGRGYIYPAG